jgi:acetyl esterase/lipase
MEAFVSRVRQQRQGLPDDLNSRVQQQRALLKSREVEQGGTDCIIAGIPCRLLRPPQSPSRGLFIHFHGGGFICGSAKSSEVENARLSSESGVAVLSVNYRLSPEHPYPAAIDDGLAVVNAVLENGLDDVDPCQVMLGGESAGAYIALSLLLRLRDRGIHPNRFRGLSLVYGGYDLSTATPSARGYRVTNTPDVMTPEETELIGSCFLPHTPLEQRRDPLISPVFADLSGLPPALLTVGAADHLLDINILLAGRWAAAGSPVELAIYPDCSHGFLRFPIELARRAQSRIDTFIRHCLSRSD